MGALWSSVAGYSCIDLRTARMHMRRFEKAAKTAALALAERQSTTVHLYETEDQLRPLDPLGRLEELLDRQEESHLRAGGGRSQPSIPADTSAVGTVEKPQKSFNELCLTPSFRLVLHLLQQLSEGVKMEKTDFGYTKYQLRTKCIFFSLFFAGSKILPAPQFYI